MQNPMILTSFTVMFNKYFLIEIQRTKSENDLKDAMLFIKYSCDTCRAVGFHTDCCPNTSCYLKQKGNNDLTPQELLSAAYKDYKTLKTTPEYEKQEKLKNVNFNAYDNFKLKIYKPVAGKSVKKAKPFNEHLQYVLMNQDRLSVPGSYRNSVDFNDT